MIWLTLPKTSPALKALHHHLDFRTKAGTIQTVDGVPVAVTEAAPVVIGPPVREGLWLADEGPGDAQSHHWGSLVAENGVLTIPQRYAIDLFGLDANGHAVTVPIDKLGESQEADWAGYDRTVIAVADGVVADAHDGVPAHKPLAPQTEPDEMTPQTLYGNYVILEVAPHVFVHYAHLRTGSVAVKAGDHIRRGEVIGHLGGTGSAGAPHLHIHVADTAGFGQSQGLPFVISDFVLAGHGSESDALNKEVDMPLLSKQRIPEQGAMPLNGDLIEFQAR